MERIDSTQLKLNQLTLCLCLDFLPNERAFWRLPEKGPSEQVENRFILCGEQTAGVEKPHSEGRCLSSNLTWLVSNFGEQLSIYLESVHTILIKDSFSPFLEALPRSSLYHSPHLLSFYLGYLTDTSTHIYSLSFSHKCIFLLFNGRTIYREALYSTNFSASSSSLLDLRISWRDSAPDELKSQEFYDPLFSTPIQPVGTYMQEGFQKKNEIT